MKLNVMFIVACGLLLSACANTAAPLPPLTATAIQAPSEAPTNVPAAAPTAVMVSPTAATAPPTRVPTQSAATTSRACTNPFFPVSSNAQWQYRLSAPSATNATASFTRTISNITANSFTEIRFTDGTRIDTTWTCANGALTTMQLANLGALTQNQIILDTTRHTGVTIPRPEEWEIGTTWRNSFDVMGQLKTNLLNLSGTGTAVARNKIGAQESMRVPAGTFRAFRVDSTIAITLKGSGAGTSTPIDLTIAQSAWFARDVGMVKTTETIASETVTTELTFANLTSAMAPTLAPKAAPMARTPVPDAVTPAPKATPSAGTIMVSLKNIAFNPSSITVHVGTSVKWTNNESSPIPHTVTSGSPNAPSGVFDSGTLNPGQSFQFTFGTPGTFIYFCRIHGAAMTGVVVVQP